MEHVAITIFGIAGVFALVSLLPPLALRLSVPYTVLLALVGVALGLLLIAFGRNAGGAMTSDLVSALQQFDLPGEAFLYIFLPVLLFEMAVQLDFRQLMDDIAPVLLLAVVAVVATTFVVGYGLAATTELALVTALLLGAIVATTDPAAVLGIFRDIGAPRRLTLVVQGESLFNDAAAIALSSLLVGIIKVGGGVDVGGTVLTFLAEFLGGGLVGWLAGRGACFLMLWLRGVRFSEVTLTVALAYLAFVLADRYLHVSGVVATVTAGLTVGAVGRTRVSPKTWDGLVETWEQLGFWSNSLIFLFAAMLVPRLLTALTLGDLRQLAVLVVAALVARGLVLYGLLPPLSALGWASRFSHAHKAVVLWGGLRGAVSLALALAVTGDPGIPEPVKHSIAILTTGFVLFTLFVNGTTLRPLLHLLKLDRLSPTEAALKDRAVALTLADVQARIAAISAREPIERPVADRLIAEVKERQHAPGEAMAELGDDDLLRFGIGTLVSQEGAFCRRRLGDGTANREIVEALIADVTRLADGLKTGGRPGYEAAARANLGFSWRFRLANWLYHRLGWEHWLAQALADRFRRLFAGSLVLTDLAGFAERKLASMAGPAASRTLALIIKERREATDRALAAFRLQYPDYSRALQEIYVGRLTLRLIEDGYRAMRAESVLSQEVFDDLMRGLEGGRRRFRTPPQLDIAVPREALVRQVRLFRGLSDEAQRRIAQLLRPRLAVPGERIVTVGEHGDAMFFIASGAVEVALKSEPVRLGSGDFFGEIALIERRPRTADVVALGYTQLLALYARDLDRLIQSDPEIGEQLRNVARERLEAQARSAH